MSPDKNPNSILFLYEGETEKEFYRKLFDLKLKKRQIRHNFGNLKGIFSIDEKVTSKIQSYLENPAYEDCVKIHVFIAYDREGEEHVPPALDKNELSKRFIRRKSRVASINEIIATQDLESWFFYDLEGIYKYLKVPKKERKMNAFPNIDKTNNRVLSALFHKYEKHYQKGRGCEGFIENLNLNKIYNDVSELKDAFDIMNNLK
jgi:hypothetical protein